MRKILNLNESWQFTDPDETMRAVHLPHIWNSIDGQNGDNDYWHGSYIYRRELAMPRFNRDEEQVCLKFQGVSAGARVSLNGSPVCTHGDGYSIFRVNVMDVLTENDLLEITVDNGVDNQVYPQKADFMFYGGIYRDVNLIVLNRLHSDMDYYEGSGIQIIPEVKGDTSVVRIWTFANVMRDGNGVKAYVDIEDGNGKKVVFEIRAGYTLLISKVHS